MRHVASRARLPCLQPCTTSTPSTWPTRLAYDWITTQHRHVSTDRERRISDEQPTVVNEDGTRTLRIRKNANKTLPISPIMDPITTAARYKHRQPKSRFNNDPEVLTAMQKELAFNPYAHALATPIRQCQLTKARMPDHFLHPLVLELPNDSSNHAQPVQLVPENSRCAPNKRRWRTNSYIVQSRRVVEHLTSKGKSRGGAKDGNSMMNSPMRRAYSKIQSLSAEAKGQGRVEWDENMPDLIEKTLREDIRKKLKHCANDSNLVSISRMNSADLPPAENVACVIALRDEEGVETKDASEDEGWFAGKMRYDLTGLYTGREYNNLRFIIRSQDCLFVLLKSKMTTHAQMALEQLRHYRAHGAGLAKSG